MVVTFFNFSSLFLLLRLVSGMLGLDLILMALLTI